MPFQFEPVPPLTLQVHAQTDWHSPALIIGKPEALIRLRDAIDRALTSKKGCAFTTLYAGDAEGYNLIVSQAEDKDFRGESYISLPYTSEVARDRRNQMRQRDPYFVPAERGLSAFDINARFRVGEDEG